MKTPSPEESEILAAVIKAGLAEPWNALPPSHRKRWVDHVLEAQKPEARARRIGKMLESVRAKAQD